MNKPPKPKKTEGIPPGWGTSSPHWAAYRIEGQDPVTQMWEKDVMKALNGHKVNQLYQGLVWEGYCGICKNGKKNVVLTGHGAQAVNITHQIPIAATVWGWVDHEIMTFSQKMEFFTALTTSELWIRGDDEGWRKGWRFKRSSSTCVSRSTINKVTCVGAWMDFVESRLKHSRVHGQ